MNTGHTLRKMIKRPQVLPALPARIYFLLIQCLGLSVLIFSGKEAVRSFDLHWLYLLFLTAAASLLSTKISGSGTRAGSVTISLGDFFVFMSMVVLGPAAAALMGAVEGLVSSLRVRILYA